MIPKIAIEAHKILFEIYGAHELPETTSSDWFKRFKIMYFDIKYENVLVYRKRLKSKNWRHYYLKTRVRLAESFGVDYATALSALSNNS